MNPQTTIANTLTETFAKLPGEELREKAALAHRLGWRSVLDDIRAEFQRRRQAARATNHVAA